MHKAIVIVYSSGVLQPSGIRRFGIELCLYWDVIVENALELMREHQTEEQIFSKPRIQPDLNLL